MSTKNPKSASKQERIALASAVPFFCQELFDFFPKRVEVLQCRPPTEPSYVIVIHIHLRIHPGCGVETVETGGGTGLWSEYN